jgi:hypothetical protein
LSLLLIDPERFHLNVCFLFLLYALSLSSAFVEFESKYLPGHVNPINIGGCSFCNIVVSWSERVETDVFLVGGVETGMSQDCAVWRRIRCGLIWVIVKKGGFGIGWMLLGPNPASQLLFKGHNFIQFSKNIGFSAGIALALTRLFVCLQLLK